MIRRFSEQHRIHAAVEKLLLGREDDPALYTELVDEAVEELQGSKFCLCVR